MTVSIRILALGLVLVALGGAANPAAAQISCGSTTTAHYMRQTPGYQRSVDVSTNTVRPTTLCPLAVRTEAWVDGLTTSYVNIAEDAYSASLTFTRAVPTWGTWHSTAKHLLIWLLSGTWQNLGNTYGQTQVLSSGTYSCPLTASSCAEGYEFKPSLCQCVQSSPILIDTAGNGYRLTNAADGVAFDIDGNGVTGEQIAWTEADSDDGWLVMDRDANGTIDSGAELFGSHTPAYADRADLVTENGFDALKMLENPAYGPGRADGIIDANDAVYSRLRVWFDRNHNGVSEPDELVALSDLGIVALSADYRENARRDQYGNKFSLMGKALVRGPGGQETWRSVYDVYLTVASPPTR